MIEYRKHAHIQAMSLNYDGGLSGVVKVARRPGSIPAVINPVTQTPLTDSYQSNSGYGNRTWTVTVPSGAQPGWLMVLMGLTVESTAGISAPSALTWNSIGYQVFGTGRIRGWWKQVESGDANTNIQLTFSAGTFHEDTVTLGVFPAEDLIVYESQILGRYHGATSGSVTMTMTAPGQDAVCGGGEMSNSPDYTHAVPAFEKQVLGTSGIYNSWWVAAGSNPEPVNRIIYHSSGAGGYPKLFGCAAVRCYGLL